MKKAFLLMFGALLMLFVACETGLPRYSPAEGSWVEGGAGNRFSFFGGGSAAYVVPDGGFAVDTGTSDTGEDDAF